MINRLLLVFACFFWIEALDAQLMVLSTISTAGDYESSGGYSLSFTLGETVIKTFTAEEMILTQGFQQPNLFVNTDLKKDQLQWNVMVWPNPVLNDLNIVLQGPENRIIIIELYDLHGRKLISRELKEIPSHYEFYLDMDIFTMGIYILRIYSPDYRLQWHFRIEKQ